MQKGHRKRQDKSLMTVSTCSAVVSLVELCNTIAPEAELVAREDEDVEELSVVEEEAEGLLFVQ